MLESVIIVLLTLMVTIAMLGLGFVYYQKAMLTNLANEVASDIASNYKYCNQTIENQIDQDLKDKLKNVPMYRTSFMMGNIKNKSKEKAKRFSVKQVNLRTLGIHTDNIKVEDYKIQVDNIGRMHVELTLSMKSEVLFSGALKAMNLMEKKPIYKATGRAECIDITAYAGHVFFIQYVEDKIGKNKTLDNIVKIYKGISSLIN